MRWFSRWIGLIALAVIAVACHQSGTVFVVDTTIDTVDSNPGDGFCRDASGDCSVRAAVMEANALPGVEEIRLVDGELYEITIDGALEDAARTGDLDITSGVVVTGDAWLSAPGHERVVDVILDQGLVEFDGPNFLDAQEAVRAQGAGAVWFNEAEATQLGTFVRLQSGKVAVLASTAYDIGPSAVFVVESGELQLRNVTTHQATSAVHNVGGDVEIAYSTLDGEIDTGSAPGVSTRVGTTILADRCVGEIESLGWNRFWNTCAGLDDATDDWIVRPGLLDNAFGVNDGSVPTLIHLPDAAFVDAGPPGPCSEERDARGFQRPFGGRCDIGAIELRPSSDCSAREPGANLRFCDLGGENFDGADLRGAEFLFANVTGATWEDADLRDSRIVRVQGFARFDGADLRGSVIDRDRVSTGGLSLYRTSLSGGSLRNAVVDIADSVDFSGADVDGVFFFARLYDLNFDGVDLSSSRFGYVRSRGITGTPAAMPAGSFLINGHIVSPLAILDDADLSGADLSSISLAGLQAHSADFSGATLSDFRGANFFQATLDDAVLDGADGRSFRMDFGRMVSASAVGADLSSGSLAASTIVGVDFSGANLAGVGFFDAMILWNVFDNTICPSGVNSNANGGNCDGQFTFGAPQAPGAPVPVEFQGREAEFTTLGGN